MSLKSSYVTGKSRSANPGRFTEFYPIIDTNQPISIVHRVARSSDRYLKNVKPAPEELGRRVPNLLHSHSIALTPTGQPRYWLRVFPTPILQSMDTAVQERCITYRGYLQWALQQNDPCKTTLLYRCVHTL